MSSPTTERPIESEPHKKGDAAVDAVRHAAHFAHEARLLKTLAADALEEGTYAAQRAVKRLKRRVQDLADTREEVVHRIKREPLKAVALALGVGMFVGAMINWSVRRCSSPRPR